MFPNPMQYPIADRIYSKYEPHWPRSLIAVSGLSSELEACESLFPIPVSDPFIIVEYFWCS